MHRKEVTQLGVGVVRVFVDARGVVGENMKIWLSKDEYRLPLMVEAKILVGSVKAILDRSASKYGDFTE